MDRPLITLRLCCVALLLAPLPSVWAQAAKAPAGAESSAKDSAPHRVYLQGHLVMGEGDKLEKAGEFAAAYFKYKEARDIFDSVFHSDSSWNTELVEYRRKRIREDMERVRQLEIKRRAAGGKPSPAGIVGGPGPAEEIAPARSATPPGAESGLVTDERMQYLQMRIEELTGKNDEVLKALGGREEELRIARRELNDSRREEASLRSKLADANTRIDTASLSEKRKNEQLTKRVQELEGQLSTAVTQLADANQKADGLLADLEKAYTENKERTRERDELSSQLSQLKALVAADGKGLNKLQIVQENDRMRKELAEAKQKLTTLSAEKEADRAQIASLQEELKRNKETLERFQAENEGYRLQVAALVGQLDDLKSRISGGGDAQTLAENGVLREITLQQLKQQAKRQAAQKNLMEELTREGVMERMKEMGVETENMLRAVSVMAAPVDLSREQREVLSNTKLDRFLTENGGGDLLMVQDSRADGSAPAAPGPEGAEPAPGETGDRPPDVDEPLTPEMQAYATAAEENFKAGDFSSAEKQYKQILMVDPRNVRALRNLAVVNLRLGNNEDAEMNLKKSQAYFYDSDSSHYLLGVAYLRMGRVDEAVEEINEGLKLNPNNANAHVTLGTIALRKKQNSEAVNQFKQAVAIDENCAIAHFNLAVFYAAEGPGKKSLAARHYETAVRNGATRDRDLEKFLGS